MIVSGGRALATLRLRIYVVWALPPTPHIRPPICNSNGYQRPKTDKQIAGDVGRGVFALPRTVLLYIFWVPKHGAIPIATMFLLIALPLFAAVVPPVQLLVLLVQPQVL